MGDANMYQRIFSAQDGGSAKKAVFFWIIGVVLLESVISMLGLAGSVAAAKGIIPDLVNNAQSGIPIINDQAMLEARQAGSESVIPAIARFAGLPLFLWSLIGLNNDGNNSLNSRFIFINSRYKPYTILNAAFTAYNIYGTSITPALLAAFLWKRATSQGAIASILTGATVTIVWTYFLPQWSQFKQLHPFLQELTYPAAGLSVFMLVCVSLLTKPPEKKSLAQFFDDSN